jgi:tetratricopeptide (TPR) repeat protein
VSGQLETARALYVAALERAPRHPELCRLVAELDATAGGRAEAALGLLAEVLPATETGSIGALLLARVGDVDGACAALRRATAAEPYGPLAALLFRRIALLEPDSRARLAALDDAVARSPGMSAPRWSRLEARVAQGDVAGAISDAEHLEAAATTNRARDDVLRRAARQLLDAGHVRDAGRLFERALRYVPDDPEATAGLARSLIEVGRADRAVALLERAIRLGEAAVPPLPVPDALIDLAKLLARRGDLPHAIARLREVQAGGGRLVEARALEAEYREKLGDIQGASLAHARVRELVELGRTDDVDAAVTWLRAAATFEAVVHGDPVLAERHLATAIRLAPRDARLSAEYREAAARVAARAAATPGPA